MVTIAYISFWVRYTIMVYYSEDNDCGGDKQAQRKVCSD